MKRLAPHDVVLIVGKRGSGKSHAAKELCGAELGHGARVVVFDPHDEYSQLGRKTDAVTLGPLSQRMSVDAMLERPEVLDDAKLSLSLVPAGDPKQVAQQFRAVADQVLDTGNMTLVADEVGVYEDFAEDHLNYAATQSRHSNVALVFVAQRMVHIPKTARTQATVVQSFLQNNPEDLTALAKLTGSKDFAADVSRLPRRKSLTWRDEEIRK